MGTTLARIWWVLALRGVLALVFGVLAFLWPGLAWIVVVASFAAFALMDGAFAIGAAITGHGHGRQWWGLIFEGILGISAGVLTLVWPGLTQLVLLYLIAYWAIATGIFEIVAAIRLRREIEGEWVLALAGVLSIGIGVVFIIMPAEGALAVAWLIAAYSVLSGILFLALAFRLRSLVRRWSGGAAGIH